MVYRLATATSIEEEKGKEKGKEKKIRTRGS